MRSALILLAICLGLISCKKEKADINSFWNCQNSQNMDSASTYNKLIGSWIWTKQACYPGQPINADKNVKITFNSNGTFNVTENSTILTQGTWGLKINDINFWGLDLTSPSNYLYGSISFCENYVLFSDSYRDGCNNLFLKLN